MGMLDGLLGGIVGAGVVTAVNGLIEKHGGLQGVVSEFERNGLGATIQSRRWCETCQHETERQVHDCGALTKPRKGLALMNNDAVNFLSTVVGGLFAVSLVR